MHAIAIVWRGLKPLKRIEIERFLLPRHFYFILWSGVPECLETWLRKSLKLTRFRQYFSCLISWTIGAKWKFYQNLVGTIPLVLILSGATFGGVIFLLCKAQKCFLPSIKSKAKELLLILRISVLSYDSLPNASVTEILEFYFYQKCLLDTDKICIPSIFRGC